MIVFDIGLTLHKYEGSGIARGRTKSVTAAALEFVGFSFRQTKRSVLKYFTISGFGPPSAASVGFRIFRSSSRPSAEECVHLFCLRTFRAHRLFDHRSSVRLKYIRVCL